MSKDNGFETVTGNGGETHQNIPRKADHNAAAHLTTN